jgi:hypothetical protein
MKSASRNEDRFLLSRRALLANSALVAAATLSGCCLHRTTSILSPVGLLPMGKPTEDLLIDAHCHVFNASDLPVKEFMSKVVLSSAHITQTLRDVAGAFVRLLAFPSPCGDEELAFLKLLSDHGTQSPSLITALQEKQYRQTRKDVQQALKKLDAPVTSPITIARRKANALGVASDIDSSTAAIMQPEASAEDYKWHLQLSFRPSTYAEHMRQQVQSLATIHTVRTKMAAGLPANRTCTSQASTLSLPGLIAYVVENNRYRITEVHNYLETFTNPDQADRNVDLMIAHLVDYDWWLRNGKANGTTLQRQVDVMAEISVYTRGQVHAFVAFDPLREIAYRCRAQHSSHDPWSSMELVTKAIGEQGCLGVKLYPPMGFGASGNAQQPPDLWKLPGLPTWLSDGSLLEFDDGSAPAPFGARLDQVLDNLFAWCEKRGVPIMAHAAASNGQNSSLEALAEAQYWIPVITNHPKLRINFGHLGDLSTIPPCASAIPPQAANLLNLFEANNHAYGDSSFDSEILGGDVEATQQRYAAAYKSTPLLGTRMLYGTDWNLLMHIGDVRSYQNRFQALAAGLPNADGVIEGHTLRDRLLGWNAVDYLGLRKGDCTRLGWKTFIRQTVWIRIIPPASLPG